MQNLSWAIFQPYWFKGLLLSPLQSLYQQRAIASFNLEILANHLQHRNLLNYRYRYHRPPHSLNCSVARGFSTPSAPCRFWTHHKRFCLRRYSRIYPWDLTRTHPSLIAPSSGPPSTRYQTSIWTPRDQCSRPRSCQECWRRTWDSHHWSIQICCKHP